MSQIAVIGSGAWGLALASHLARMNHDVLVWCHAEEVADQLRESGVFAGFPDVVLPSSIHEMLILPYDDSIDMDVMSEMVREINATQVSPEERLTDQAYLIEVK